GSPSVDRTMKVSPAGMLDTYTARRSWPFHVSRQWSPDDASTNSASCAASASASGEGLGDGSGAVSGEGEGDALGDALGDGAAGWAGATYVVSATDSHADRPVISTAS